MIGEAKPHLRIVVATGVSKLCPTYLWVDRKALRHPDRVLGALEDGRVVVDVLHLQEHREVGREGRLSGVRGGYNQAVPLGGLVVQTAGQGQVSEARLYREQPRVPGARGHEAVADQTVAARVRVTGDRGVQRYSKLRVLRNWEADRRRVELGAVVVHVVYHDFHLQANKLIIKINPIKF